MMRSFSLLKPLNAVLLMTTSLTPLLARSVVAQSLPTGASVAYGSVGFARSSGTLTINQGSQNAIVNYNSFSIGRGNTVNINQPNSSSALLNRVTGNTPSTIAGQLNANGQVYLINPNGIAITKTGVVKVGGGFVASSLGMSDSDFLKGKRTFRGNGSSARVSNAGTITIGRGGYAALIGGEVRNSGTIAVPMGKVGLGSGEMATLDVSGDGFLQVALPTTASGKGALVSNSGLISAAGGTVVLDAATARAAARSAVNISGSIDAHSISGHSGSIIIGGGDGGRVAVSGRLNVAGSTRVNGGTIAVTGRKVKVSGTIDASGRSGGKVTLAATGGTKITGTVKAVGRAGKGGAITVTGLTIAFVDANVDASGTTGGGTVKIGGDLHGGGTLAHAQTTEIDTKSVIVADATGKGDGGSVVVWSDETTHFAGLISAKGGPLGGDGGQVEVSSHGVLDYKGLTQALAPLGRAGTLLLDPYNVTVSTGTDTNPGVFTASANDSVINNTTLSNALANASVTVSTGTAGSQAGTITVSAPVAWNTANTLTLNAAGSIAINSNITASSDQLAVSSGGAITQTGGTGITASTLTATASGVVHLTGSNAIATLGASSGGDFALTNSGVLTTASVTANTGDLSLTTTGGTLTVGGTLTAAGDITLQTNRSLTLGASLSGGQGQTVTLAAGGTISQTGGTISAGTLTGSSVGGASFAKANTITTLGSFTDTGNGNLSLQNTASTLTVAGALSLGTGSASLTNTGAIAITAPLTLTGGLTLNATSAITDTQALSVGTFTLAGGAWNQNTATLPSFSATKFTLAGGSFLRAQGGDGSTGTPYLIADVYGLQGVGTLLSSNFALANSIDASQTSGWNGGAGFVPIGNGSNAYSGTFNGNGHTISNLTIDRPSSSYGGLFGKSSGTIENIGLLGGAVTGGNDYFGDLVGYNSGTITQAYATGAVSGLNDVGGLVGYNVSTITQGYAAGSVSGTTSIGGLVGYNVGTITRAYATGAVSGAVSGSSDVGGLVGFNYIGGTITQAYATGAISGSNQVGGLVGYNYGSITQAYATGSVSGSEEVGGLVGFNFSTITQGYWDTKTSGASTGIGSDADGQSGNVTGLTTAQFQSGSASGLGTAFAGGANGLYPYLTSFFPNGVQAVSGIAYADAGVTAASGRVVGLIANGQTFGSATTGADGYFYIIAPAGTAANGTSLLAYGTGLNSATLTSVSGTAAGTGTAQSGANLYANAVTVPTTQTSLTAFNTKSSAPSVFVGVVGTAQGLAEGADDVAQDARAAINGATGVGLIASGSSFTLNAPVTTSSTFLVQTTASGAPITVAAGNPITIQSGGSLGFNAAGALAINANITVPGTGSVALTAPMTSVSILAGNGTISLLNLTFAQGASLSFTGTNAMTGAPAGSLTINGTPYTLLNALANNGSTGPDTGKTDIAGIDNNTAAGGDGGHYALATNLDGTGTTFGAPLAGSGGNTFSGTLEGLGHTIANLTISDGGDANVGFIGQNSGTLRDIGLVGGSVSGTNNTGFLVGLNTGIVAETYETGAVNGGGSYAGGLVGSNGYNDFYGIYGGTIIQSYATGAVSNAFTAGGLVGHNDFNGTITQSYATGAVGGSETMYAGGLVGDNIGQSSNAITQVYATGAVSGSSPGGLVGDNMGFIQNAYWDTQTTGQSNGIGPYGQQSGNTFTGYTTAQLQGTAPISGNTYFSTATALGSAFGGGSGGVYPYLKSFFPNGVQTVSGLAYQDTGATLLTGNTVSVIANNQSFGNVTTGANGYYYAFGPAGSLASGTTVLATTSANTGATNAATLALATGTTNQQNVTIFGNTVTVPTTTTSLATYLNNNGGTLAAAQTAAQTAAEAADDANHDALASIQGAAGLGLVASGTSFKIDAPVTTVGTNFLVQTTASGAPIIVTAPITINDSANASGGLGLLAAGALSIDANVTVTGAGVAALAYDRNTTTPSVTDLAFAQGSSLSFTGVDQYNTPLGTLVINGAPYTLLTTMTYLGYSNSYVNVADIGGGVLPESGNYALAFNLEGTGLTFSGPLVGPSGQAFTGTFEGLGHTISNLTIASGTSYVGLVGQLGAGGTVRDIGLVGGSVAGSDYVGALVGYDNGGTVAQAYATGAVSGSAYVGGLVGYDINGTIAQAYATGAVSGTSDAGGLVGFVGSGSGAVTQSYATGAVAGTTAVGGLAGVNYGTITQSYATGAVSGSSSAGGLAGANYGTVTQAYWDIQTSGQASSAGGTGLTTRQLQGLDPLASGTITDAGHLGAAFAGGTGGLYPYLTSFFPTGVQAVSGLAYTNAGAILLSSPAGATTATTRPGLVTVATNGVSLGKVTTGVNGYYYVFAPAGTLPAGTDVAAITNADPTGTMVNGKGGSGAQNAATFFISNGGANQNGSSAVTNVYGGWQYEASQTGTTVSALNALDAATAGALLPTGIANREINATGGIAVDTAVTLTGTLVLKASGSITQSAPITAGGLLFSASLADLTGANAIATVAGVTTSGASLVTTGATTVGALTDATGTRTSGLSDSTRISLVSGGNQTLAANVAAPTVLLAADGTLTNNVGAGAVNAPNGFTIYTQNPSNSTGALPADSFAGLAGTNYYNDAFNFGTDAFASAVPSGNHFVYSYAASLTPTLGGTAAKTYDGTTTAPTGNLTIAATGFANANGGTDAATLSFTGASYATANAGVGKTVTASGIVLVSNPDNYMLGATAAAASVGTINPATLTYVAAAAHSTYGTTPSGLTGTVSGFVAGQTLQSATGGTLTFGTTATGSSIVGSYAVTGSGLTANNGNYTFVQAAGNMTALTVSPASLIITASNQAKTYGMTASLGRTAFSETGLVNGDTISGVTLASTGAASTATVAGNPYAINASAATGSGLSNYTIGYVAGQLTVNPAALIITASNQAKTYGTTASLGGTAFSETGLVNGDTISGVTLASTGSATTATVAASPYAINASAATGSGLSNYTIGYVAGQLTVNPASLIITASNQAKTYGTTASLGGTAFSETGLVNGDTISGVTLASTGSATTATVAASPYAINASAATGSGLSNYTIGYVAGQLTVNPASLIITASNQAKTYGTTASLGGTAFSETGLVNGDTISGVTLASTGSATTATVAASPYAINASAATGSGLSNYTIGYVAGQLTVNPAALIITASNQAKTYGMTASLGGTAFSETGLVNGDTISGVTLASTGSATTATVAASPYAINASAATGSGLSNYTIGYVAGQLTVNPASLIITASNQAKTYGTTASLGGTAFSETGLVNGDTISGVTLASTGSATTATVAASPYAINASAATGSGLSNYTIGYVAGQLTVNPASLIITASNQAKTYGTTASLGGTAFSETGLVNGDTISGVTLASTGSATTATVAASPYAINASAATGSGLSNYTIGYVAGQLTVNPASLIITASNQAKTYGTTASLGGTAFSETGLVNGDTISGVTLASTGSATTATVAASPYAINASAATGSGLSNYTIGYVAGQLTVNPASLIITASNQAKTYGTTASLGGTAFGETGLVNGDTISGVTLASTGSATTATVAASPYAINASAATGSGLSNYTIGYVAGQLTVNPAALVRVTPPVVGLAATGLGSTIDMDLLETFGSPGETLPFVISTLGILRSSDNGSLASQLVQDLSNPRFDEIIVCLKGACTLVPVTARTTQKTSQLETNVR